MTARYFISNCHHKQNHPYMNEWVWPCRCWTFQYDKSGLYVNYPRAAVKHSAHRATRQSSTVDGQCRGPARHIHASKPCVYECDHKDASQAINSIAQRIDVKIIHFKEHCSIYNIHILSVCMETIYMYSMASQACLCVNLFDQKCAHEKRLIDCERP